MGFRLHQLKWFEEMKGNDENLSKCEDPSLELQLSAKAVRRGECWQCSLHRRRPVGFLRLRSSCETGTLRARGLPAGQKILEASSCLGFREWLSPQLVSPSWTGSFPSGLSHASVSGLALRAHVTGRVVCGGS